VPKERSRGRRPGTGRCEHVAPCSHRRGTVVVRVCRRCRRTRERVLRHGWSSLRLRNKDMPKRPGSASTASISMPRRVGGNQKAAADDRRLTRHAILHQLLDAASAPCGAGVRPVCERGPRAWADLSIHAEHRRGGKYKPACCVSRNLDTPAPSAASSQHAEQSRACGQTRC
jgi:hypothetical protein